MINVFKPYMGQEEIDAVAEVIKSGRIGLGPKTKEFEDMFAERLGLPYALGMNSATAALHLALDVIGVAGKEVITTPMTFVSTNHAILYNHGIPIFTDIEKDTLNIDPSKIEANITDNTKVIMVVHYGGHACDMDTIMEIAKKHNLYVVEDCAHACGGTYKGKPLGTIGHIGCFSFQGVKNMATGDGGMLVTQNKEWYEKVKHMRWCGIEKDTHERSTSTGYAWFYDITCAGYKYHMNDLAAAIGIVQFGKLQDMNEKRSSLAERYTTLLADMDTVQPLEIKSYAGHAHHNYCVKVEQRNKLYEYLKGYDISTSVHYYPNNMYDMYTQYGNATPVCHDVWQSILLLPLYPSLTFDEQDFVVEKIKEFYSR